MQAPTLGLDHVVILVRDLTAAAQVYERLGFALAPEMHHGFGTGNRIATLDHNFLELVGVVTPDQLQGPGTLIADALAQHGEGAFGLALSAREITADVAALQGRGVQAGPIGGGRRGVPLPDGTHAEARFSTAMLGLPRTVTGLAFLAQQHVPEVVWVPEWQRHPNTAQSLTGVVLAADAPTQLWTWLSSLYGIASVHQQGTGIRATTPAGVIEVSTPAGIRERFGLALEPTPGTARFVAATVSVRDPAALERCCGEHGVPLRRSGGRLIVAPEFACGTTLEFVPAYR